MRIPVLAVFAAAAVATFPGCALAPVEMDTEAAHYATAWELPRPEQLPVLLYFKLEGKEGNADELAKTAAAILLGSGKFRIATPEDEPAYRIELAMRTRRMTDHTPAVLAAFVLYIVPAPVEEVVWEVFADVRRTSPPHEVVAHCYAQGRAERTVWIGNLFSGACFRNAGVMDAIRRDALKAATVRMCRALAPGETK